MKLTFRQYSEYKHRVKMYEAFVTEFERQEELEDAINEELNPDQKQKIDKTVSKIPNRDEKIKKFWGKQNLNGSYDDNFKNGRMTVPIEFDGDSKPHPIIDKFISEKGYTIKDYKSGTASRKETVGDPSRGIPNKEVEREYKIGKVLQKEGASEGIIKMYNNDPARASSGASKYDLVITHHPHDVAGKSTNRGWSSCMDLSSGECRSSINDDLKQMTHEAYLVKQGENVDSNPIARVSLKLHRSLNSTHSVLVPEDEVYGTAPKGFKEKVKDIVSKISPLKDNNIYQKHPDLYDDDGKREISTIKSSVSPKQLDKLFGKLKDSSYGASLLKLVDKNKKYEHPILDSYQKIISDADNPEKFKGDFDSVLDYHANNINNIHKNTGMYVGKSNLSNIIKKLADHPVFHDDTTRENVLSNISPISHNTNLAGGLANDVKAEVLSKPRNAHELKDALQLMVPHKIKLDPKTWKGSGDPAADYLKHYNAGEYKAAHIINASKGFSGVPKNEYEHLGKLSKHISGLSLASDMLDDTSIGILQTIARNNATAKINHLGLNRPTSVVFGVADNHEYQKIPQDYRKYLASKLQPEEKYSREHYPEEHKLLDDFDKKQYER